MQQPYVDYTLLRPDATLSDYENFCREALDNSHVVRSVCILPDPAVIRTCQASLGERMKICVVNDFPYGRGGWKTKLEDAAVARRHRIDEIDTVLNARHIREENYSAAKQELEFIFGGAMKVIVETGYVWYDERRIKKVAELVAEIGAFCIKTSTGVVANIEPWQKVQHVVWMHEAAPHLTIKVAGGIKTMEQVKMFFDVVPREQLIIGASAKFWE